MLVLLHAADFGGWGDEDVVGVHVAGEDGVAADAVFAEVYGHAFGQANDAGFGAAVRCIGFPSSAAVDGRGAADSAAVSLFDHFLGGSLAAEVVAF